jgi:hypothetical protein
MIAGLVANNVGSNDRQLHLIPVENCADCWFTQFRLQVVTSTVNAGMFVLMMRLLKTLKRPVRVVWVFRKTQWIAMFTTDLELSVSQIIEYYGARWEN